MNRHLLWVLPIIAATLLSSPARGSSITLGPSHDNTMYAESDTLSNGAGTRLFAGENGTGSVRRGLIKFDLTGLIYSGATIDSVVLRLSVVQAHPTSVTVRLHRLLADWGEGTSIGTGGAGGEGAGGKASSGDATWSDRFFGPPAQLWTAPGGDFVAAASASRSVFSLGAYTWRSANLTADVAFWLANPAQNFGWLVAGNEVTGTTAKAFGSRQNGTVANRPVLTIYYSIPSAAGALPPVVRLFPVHPNPFNPSAGIRYELASSQGVTITVYDTTGRLVRTLVDGVMPAGTNETVWHGDDTRGGRVASGVYVVKLVTANAAPLTRKMVLLK